MKAIVEGEPPGLPSEGYSATAQDFVKACVNKIPSKRHTYPMLLAHPWLKSLTKPETIAEDSEGEEAATHGETLAAKTARLNLNRDGVYDREVADWVQQSFKQLDADDAAKMKTVRPALHAAPLDTVKPVGGLGF